MLGAAAPDAPSRLVLLGHPVAHSLSPRFQNAALTAARLRVRYEALDVPPDELDATLATLAGEGAGGNVTIPHKEAVASAAYRLTPLAARVGAVNTFWHEQHRLVGHNTDVAGALATIDALLPVGLGDRSCVVLGAGGSAAAVLVALEQLGCHTIHLVARTTGRADALRVRVGIPATVHSWPDRTTTAQDDPAWAAIEGAGLIINATTLGLDPGAVPMPVDRFAADAAVFDLVYAAEGTAWVQAARARGLQAEDGLRMLVEQGAAAFACWFGQAPSRRSMWRALGVVPGVVSSELDAEDELTL